MNNSHTVNNTDGLSSLGLIAKHYRVPLVELVNRNPHVMSRYPPGSYWYGCLKLGDKILIPSSQAVQQQNKSQQGPVGSKSYKNELIDENPWRAFFFILADEILPSGKLVRKILEYPSPFQAQYLNKNPRIFGFAPPNPSSLLSLGEHALGENQSRYISASTKPRGAPTMVGSRFYIDIKKILAAGVKVHSTDEIIADLDRLLMKDASLRHRIEQLKRVIKSVEGEVLIEGAVPASAIKTAGEMLLTRGLRAVQVVGIAFTVRDVGSALKKSVERKSVDPITAEGIRQVGGWAGAVAGTKIGAMAGATVGIEAGPGAIATGALGALVFGTAGYLGADWVADFIDAN